MHKLILICLLCTGLIFSTPLFATSILQSLTDSIDSAIINVKVYTDKSLTNTHIDAIVINGTAIFRGTVSSDAQLNELIQIAHSVASVKNVDATAMRIIEKNE